MFLGALPLCTDGADRAAVTELDDRDGVTLARELLDDKIGRAGTWTSMLSMLLSSVTSKLVRSSSDLIISLCQPLRSVICLWIAKKLYRSRTKVKLVKVFSESPTKQITRYPACKKTHGVLYCIYLFGLEEKGELGAWCLGGVSSG